MTIMETTTDSHCFIIAEAGVNHNGSMAMALDLVAAAKQAGADAVKFQTFIAEEEISQFAPKADYQKALTGESESQLEMVKKLELNEAQHYRLIECCRSHEIEFMSSPFDLKSIALLEKMHLNRIKIPSGEITNLPYLRRIAAMGLPVILSTGMSEMPEIEAAVGVLVSVGLSRGDITVLHCNTEYPTPMCDVNLRAMLSIGQALGVATGFSDHTLGNEVPIAAVSLGAVVIEKHLTLDRTLPGPDHKASLEPQEFRAMVQAIRNIEMALGDGCKRVTSSEEKNRMIARKSIVAAVPIRRDESFTAQNLTTKRPGTGLSPMRWDEITGQKARRDFEPDEEIEL